MHDHIIKNGTISNEKFAQKRSKRLYRKKFYLVGVAPFICKV